MRRCRYHAGSTGSRSPWGVVVVRRVESAGVEPPLDPTDQITARIGSGGPSPAVSELAFHRAEPALSDRVVPAHPSRSHRLHDTVVLAQLTEGSRRVDRPSVAVKDQTVDVAASDGDGHGERVGAEPGAHLIRCGPADHPTGEQVDDGGQVEPALTGVQIRNVAAPHDVRGGRVELAPDVVRCCGRTLVDDSGADPAPTGLALDAQLAHDPPDPLAGASRGRPGRSCLQRPRPSQRPQT